MRRTVGRQVREARTVGGEKMDEHAVAEIEADERHPVPVPRDGLASERGLAGERGGRGDGVRVQPRGQRRGVGMREIKGFAGGDDFAEHRQPMLLPVGQTVRFPRPQRRDPREHRQRRGQRPSPRPRPPRPPPAHFRARENPRPQIPRHLDRAQMRGHRTVKRLLLREPRGERRIIFRRLDRRRKSRVVRVLPVRAVGAEKQTRLVAHAAPFCAARIGTIFPAASVFASSSSCRSCAFPRDSRDITVPMGISRMSAIS